MTANTRPRGYMGVWPITSTAGEWSRNWYTPEKLAYLREIDAARIAKNYPRGLA
jgi:hypothetical protein